MRWDFVSKLKAFLGISPKKESHINIMKNKTLSKEVMSKLKYQRSFEIAIEEKDEREDGTEFWKPVLIDTKLGGNGRVVITVNSPKDLNELQQQYNMAGQRFKIVHEINPPTQDDLYDLAVKQGLISDDAVETSEPDVSAPVSTNVETTDVSSRVSQTDHSTVPSPVTPAPTNVSNRPSSSPMAGRQPIKYYKIGDIEIKDDNGKIYQKQWLALTDSEAANLRVISTKDNKIVNLTGKRFEMKKWVAVEMTTDAATSLEENLR